MTNEVFAVKPVALRTPVIFNELSHLIVKFPSSVSIVPLTLTVSPTNPLVGFIEMAIGDANALLTGKDPSSIDNRVTQTIMRLTVFISFLMQISQIPLNQAFNLNLKF